MTRNKKKTECLTVIISTTTCVLVQRVYVNKDANGNVHAFYRHECTYCRRVMGGDAPLEIVRLGEKTKIHKE